MARHGSPLPKIELQKTANLETLKIILANSDKIYFILLNPTALIDKDSCNNNLKAEKDFSWESGKLVEQFVA